MSTAITPEAYQAGEKAMNDAYFASEPVSGLTGVLADLSLKEVLRETKTVEELAEQINRVAGTVAILRISHMRKAIIRKMMDAYLGAVTAKVGVPNPNTLGRSPA